MREKGFVPILIIILIAAVMGGYLVYSGKINLNKSQPVITQPTPSSSSTAIKDEIATWKTYTNKDYGFLFMYPPQFALKEKIDPADQQDPVTLYRFLFYIAENGEEKFSGYSLRIHIAPGKTILQEFPQEFRQQAPSIPVKTLSNTQGADEAASAGKSEDGYQSGIRYFRVKDTFFEINPIYQDSNSDDKIWNYPILDTLAFNKESKSEPTSEDLNGFPVYPGSKFVGKEVTLPCNENSVGMMCGSTVYTWTSDNADKVYDWYKNDPEGSGWKINGGGGSFTNSQDYGINGGIKKGDLVYGLNMSTTGNNKVSYSLGISIKK